MKDKTKDVGFVVLKSKMYSYIKKDDEGDKKWKGINKSVTKNIMHEEYKNTLFEKKKMRHNMKKKIQSKSHQLGQYDIKDTKLTMGLKLYHTIIKISINYFDRFVTQWELIVLIELIRCHKFWSD